MVFALNCSVDGRVLLILLLANSFHDVLHVVLLSGWQWIAHSSDRQWLSRRFAHHVAEHMAADCAFFLSSTAFMTVFVPYCSVDGSVLLILPLFNGFHDGLRTILPCRWHRIAHSCTRQHLSRWFARRISQHMAAYCSFFLSSTAFTTVFEPYCSPDRSLDRVLFRSYAPLQMLSMPYGSTEGKSPDQWVHSYLTLVGDFANVLRAVDCSLYCSIFCSSTSVIPGRFTYRIPQWMAADCSFLHSSMAFKMVFAPYCSADS